MKVELALETVTPLFLGGADQQPELRPASVRGALRFWLRAVVGGVVGSHRDVLTKVHDLEAAVFGETERRSAVVVRIVNATNLNTGEEPLLPHRFGSNPQKAGLTKAFTAGMFHLVLSLRPGADEKALKMAAWSAMLWLTLGGIGRRSRRGAGSLRLKTVVAIPSEFADIKACLDAATDTEADAQSLANRIDDLLDKARDAFTIFAGMSRPSASSGLPSFSVLGPSTRVIVWTPGATDLTNYNEALDRLMSKMHELKASSTADFAAAFGGINPRRASPLHVTAHRLQNEWALVLTHLKAKIQSNLDGKPEKIDYFFDDLIESQEAKPAHPRPKQGSNRL